MKTLQYYWVDGTHTVFKDYTIDEHVNIRNKKSQVLTWYKNRSGYNKVSICHEGKPRQIRVARAIASTFLGPPATTLYTADHEDGDRNNDTIKNIRWLVTGSIGLRWFRSLECRSVSFCWRTCSSTTRR